MMNAETNIRNTQAETSHMLTSSFVSSLSSVSKDKDKDKKDLSSLVAAFYALSHTVDQLRDGTINDSKKFNEGDVKEVNALCSLQSVLSNQAPPQAPPQVSVEKHENFLDWISDGVASIFSGDNIAAIIVVQVGLLALCAVGVGLAGLAVEGGVAGAAVGAEAGVAGAEAGAEAGVAGAEAAGEAAGAAGEAAEESGIGAAESAESVEGSTSQVSNLGAACNAAKSGVQTVGKVLTKPLILDGVVQGVGHFIPVTTTEKTDDVGATQKQQIEQTAVNSQVGVLQQHLMQANQGETLNSNAVSTKMTDAGNVMTNAETCLTVSRNIVLQVSKRM